MEPHTLKSKFYTSFRRKTPSSSSFFWYLDPNNLKINSDYSLLEFLHIHLYIWLPQKCVHVCLCALAFAGTHTHRYVYILGSQSHIESVLFWILMPHLGDTFFFLPLKVSAEAVRRYISETITPPEGVFQVYTWGARLPYFRAGTWHALLPH